MKTLNGQDVANMVEHWSETPMNGYLGSTYGQTFKSYLQQPQTTVAANSFIQKLREDVPVLQILPDSAVELSAAGKGVDGIATVISVAGRHFELSEV